MKILQDSVPATVQAAVVQLDDGLLDRERQSILKRSDDWWKSEHHTYGQLLRNAWSLWAPDTPLKRDAVKTYGISHADDISDLIMTWLRARVCGDPFDPIARCEFYKQHWQCMGMNALEAGGWRPDGRGPLLQQYPV